MSFLQCPLRLTRRFNRVPKPVPLRQTTPLVIHVRRTLSTISDAPLSYQSTFTSAAPESTDAELLAGTVPPHKYYFFIPTEEPPSAYPAKHSTPLQRNILAAARPVGGIANFAWFNPEISWPGRLMGFSAEGECGHNIVSLESVNISDLTIPKPIVDSASPYTYLFVCTHGAQDCRCGTTGKAVADAIRSELLRRQQNPSDPSQRIRLAEVAHVGGHKYAANVLIYPHGEWLGRVIPENVPEILDAVLEREIRPMYPDEKPICLSHWRGRMGLSKEEQIELFNRWSIKSD